MKTVHPRILYTPPLGGGGDFPPVGLGARPPGVGGVGGWGAKPPKEKLPCKCIL
jgi:hypothetical protein